MTDESIDLTADINGPAGKAERFTSWTTHEPAQAATLAMWLIHAPGQSPAWSHYALSIIHLRDIPGVKPATIREFGATHEMILCALNDVDLLPRVNDELTVVPLFPVNAECQFMVNSDDDAIRLGYDCAWAIVNGAMPAEPAFPMRGRRQWQTAVNATAEHFRTGGHHE